MFYRKVVRLEAYRTVRRQAETEIIIKRSRFLGKGFPVQNEQQAQEILARIKKEYWDATHNCYAYALRSGTRRFSDDGEPQGTAGKPILEILEKEGITDCLLIVTRYFGGVLLGAGGLVRAYGKAVKEALEAAGPVWMRPCARSRFSCEYHQYGRLSALVSEAGGEIADTQFTSGVTVTFLLPEEAGGRFQKLLSEASSGSVEMETLGIEYRAE